MTFFPPLRAPTSWPLLCSCGLLALGSLLAPAPGQAQPWGRPTYAPPPLQPSPAPYPGRRPQSPYGSYGDRWAPSAPGPETVYDNDPAGWALSEAQINQRCNVGRLVGGLIGGGMGYATSRQDGRSWAVPLGALLGSQMGCNVGTGRGPVPW
jgi:hypothetical protein